MDPRKSILESGFAVVENLVSGGRKICVPMAESTENGIKIKKAHRQPRYWLMLPPMIPPRPRPVLYIIVPKPCHIPLCLKGIRSEPMKVVMELHPPPPIPASTRPRTRMVFVCATPQTRFPIANRVMQKMKPRRRP